jgi:hypothetical protein
MKEREADAKSRVGLLDRLLFLHKIFWRPLREFFVITGGASRRSIPRVNETTLGTKPRCRNKTLFQSKGNGLIPSSNSQSEN